METPSRPSEVSPEFRRSFLDLFPTPEDWEALQGGKPRVFRHPRRPQKAWIILHVYDEHADARRRFKSGAIVGTKPPEGPIQLLRKGITRRDPETGRDIQRDIMVPSFMDRNVHGDICAVRSEVLRGEDYARLKSQPRYEEYILRLQKEGWEELRFGVTQDGFCLTPLPTIRPPRPLETAA